MYSALFYGGLVLAIIFLVASVILFFVLKIPKVFGDLTGRTEKKAIEEIQKTGYENKSKQEAIHDKTSRISVRDVASETQTLEAAKKKPEPTKTRIPTRLFDDSTEILGHEEKESVDYDSTEILGSESDSTDILTHNGGTQKKPAQQYETYASASAMDMDEGATDVLTSVDDDELGATDVLASNADDEYGATDVLTASPVEEEDEYGTTDVLTSSENTDEGETAVLTAPTEDEEGATAVLTSSPEGYSTGRAGTEVYGSDNEAETAVLTNNVADKTSAPGRSIVSIYSVTVVHTEENL